MDLTPGMTVWLASYPKSGNTWVRAQFDALASGREPDLNGLSRSSASDAMDARLGLALGDLSEAEVAAALRLSWALGACAEGRPIPDGVAPHASRPRVLRKTHRAWLPAADGVAAPWQPPDAKAIYIVRDPRAVVVSWAHHLGVSIDEAAAMMADPGAAVRRADTHGAIELASWSRHVTSWLDECSLPVLLVRYEDMLARPHEELARMAGFIGEEASEERIVAAVESCSFATLAVREIAEGFREAADPHRAFFRRGEAEAWREEAPADVITRVESDHAAVMQRLGY